MFLHNTTAFLEKGKIHDIEISATIREAESEIVLDNFEKNLDTFLAQIKAEVMYYRELRRVAIQNLAQHHEPDCGMSAQ